MDYRTYTFSKKEYFIYGLIYIATIGVISYLFYYSVYPVIIFSPAAYFYFKYLKKHLKQKRDKKLTLQFNDLINTLNALLSTGRSLENAIMECKKELISLHGDSMILNEIEQMTQKLKLHIPPENIFSDFAERTDIDHIKMFSEILSIAKRSGGDLIHIILSTSASISSQINIQREIDTILSGRRFELYVMSVMPLLIMFYIKLSQPGFFDSVYGNPGGIVIMSLCLLLYGAAIFTAHRILSC